MLRTVKERAQKVLEFVQKCAKACPEVRNALLIRISYLPDMLPQILDGDGIEYTRDSEEDLVLMRRLAAESIVLLKNEKNLLPLQPQVSIIIMRVRFLY